MDDCVQVWLQTETELTTVKLFCCHSRILVSLATKSVITAPQIIVANVNIVTAVTIVLLWSYLFIVMERIIYAATALAILQQL